MAEVQELHVYWYDKRDAHRINEAKAEKAPYGQYRKKIVIYPSGPTAIQMKTDVAKSLKKIKRFIYQYYVVARVKKGDGTNGYRVVVPMVVF